MGEERRPTTLRRLRAAALCSERLQPDDPEFLRVIALNGAILLLGGAGLAFALFNATIIGTPDIVPLVGFDLCAFAAAAVVGVYLSRTHDARGSAIAVNAACFTAFLSLMTLRGGGEYFVVWTMLYPPLVFMLQGLRVGLACTLAFLLVLYTLAAGGLGVWNHGHLDGIALSNLVGSSLALTGLVVVYEAARRHALRRLAAIREELEHTSIRDGLTGIHNRRYFNEVLPRELARASREHRRLVLMILDVDHFKSYNDHFGHPAGDRVLIRIASELAGVLRRSEDLVFRVGGEEFAVLCHVRSLGEAQRTAQQVRAAVEAMRIPAPTESAAGVITVSVGYAAFSADHGLGADAAYALVDRALYRAKRAGRNRVERADTEAD